MSFSEVGIGFSFNYFNMRNKKIYTWCINRSKIQQTSSKSWLLVLTYLQRR